MDNPLVICLLAIAGACMFLQVLGIVKLSALRKRHGDQPKLEERPDVKKLMRHARWEIVALVILSFSIAYLSQGAPVFVIVLGLSVGLLITASVISDNSSRHGDGGSGE